MVAPPFCLGIHGQSAPVAHTHGRHLKMTWTFWGRGLGCWMVQVVGLSVVLSGMPLANVRSLYICCKNKMGSSPANGLSQNKQGMGQGVTPLSLCLVPYLAPYLGLLFRGHPCTDRGSPFVVLSPVGLPWNPGGRPVGHPTGAVGLYPG